ncbi:aminopeptidase P family protein [bacterium]|nr:aminopeptidase P family protein [bacterium]
MRHERPPKEFFQNNRKKFIEQMEKSSIAYFYSSDEVLRNGDVHHEHRPNNNLFYLAGIEDPECKLLLCPEYDRFQEVLFIPYNDPSLAVWNGPMITVEEAKEISGIETVMYTNSFEAQFSRIQKSVENIYAKLDGTGRDHAIMNGVRFADYLRYNFPGLNIKKTYPISSELRVRKQKEELNLMQKAIEITEKGFRAVIDECKGGIYEFDLQATFSYTFLKNRSMRYGYQPIIACGKNAATLHYADNNEQLKDGELLLLDVGAEYCNYTADVTRVYPVNGKFSERQKLLYSGLLEIQKELVRSVKPEITFKELQEKTVDLIGKFLLEIKLITDVKDAKKYYMHHVSHFLGLSVHDIGNHSGPLPAGAVITIEPGIYIPEEGIGLRIEDDVLVTESGYENLSQNIPKEIDEIEKLMAK